MSAVEVGFHRQRAEPGSDLARARIAAHEAFDSIWKWGHMSRSAAYDWLANELGLTRDDCHMVLFDAPTCDRVKRICDRYIFAKVMDL